MHVRNTQLDVVDEFVQAGLIEGRERRALDELGGAVQYFEHTLAARQRRQ